MDSSELQLALQNLNSLDTNTRRRAIDKIAELRPERAFELIIPFLKDEESEVRVSTLDALEEFKDPRALPYILQLLENESHWKPRLDAFHVLHLYHGPESLDFLLRDAYREKPFRTSRRGIASELKFYDTEEVVDTLIFLLQHDDDYLTYEYAAKSLLKLNRSRLRPVWLKALNSRSSYVRTVAKRGLIALDQIEGLPASNWLGSHATLNEQDIQKVEQLLGVEFPISFKQFVQQYHGSYPVTEAFDFVQSDGVIKSGEVGQILSFDLNYTPNIVTVNQDWFDQLGKLIIFASPRGEWSFLDFRHIEKSKEPTIAYWSVEYDFEGNYNDEEFNPYPIANSFAEYLEMLYQPAQTNSDPDHDLDEAY